MPPKTHHMFMVFLSYGLLRLAFCKSNEKSNESIASVAVVVLSITFTIIFFIGRALYREKRGIGISIYSIESNSFGLDFGPTREYEAFKDTIKSQYWSEGDQDESSPISDEDYESLHSDSLWMRKVKGDVRKRLKGLLLRRAINVIPIYHEAVAERHGKFKLFRHNLIPLEQLEQADGIYRTVVEEIDDILHEAETMERGWRETILSHAAAIYKLQSEKQKEEKEIKEVKMNAAMRKEAQLAEKAADNLMQEICTKKK